MPARWATRSCVPSDVMELAQLYFRAYPPDYAIATLEEAQADIAATFAGEHGEFWPAASPMVFCGTPLVGAVLTVRRASWQNAPAYPCFFEIFTAPERRRQGLARVAVAAAMATLHAAGEHEVALTVAAENGPALSLYRSLGCVDARSA